MNLVFFQNCVSPHQVPYIKELCSDKRVDSVYLVVPRVDYRQRVSMGWDSSHLLDGTSVRLLLNPSDDNVERLFLAKDTYAFFSGIRADKDVFRWLKLSLKFNVKRGIITEAPYIYRFPLFMHYMRFFLRDYMFIRKIQYVYAIGSLAVGYYYSWNEKWKVIPFAYCTDTKDCKSQNECESFLGRKLGLLFVGSIDKRKNVSLILTVLGSLHDGNIMFHVIGDGPERKRLEAYVQKKHVDNVVFHGRMDMAKVHAMMSGFDALILPSRYDGWGAVVNEALQCGLYVICSDKCGAKDLLVNERLGRVFHSKKSLNLVLYETVKNISTIRQECTYRKTWAECISGKSLAKYFVDNLLSRKKIMAPWKANC